MAKKYTQEEFIEKAKAIHGDKYDYSKVEYVNGRTKICIICPEHGEFWQIPNSHLMGKGCKMCGIENTVSKNSDTQKDFIEKAKANETKESPVNARTIFHLAQTIAHITQLRLVNSEEERLVTLQDVSHFKWDNRMKGKVGFV